jgi:tetratricopeptide (TPR) repeat protein
MNFFNNMRVRAAKAIGSRNYDAAIEAYKKMLETDEPDSYALTMLAVCYESKGDMETALKYANQELAQNPKNFYVLLFAARYWSNKDNEDQTYNYVCRALENVPSEEFENIRKVINFIFRLCSIFKKNRGLEARAKKDEITVTKYNKETIEWAIQYKQWYEAKHTSSD